MKQEVLANIFICQLMRLGNYSAIILFLLHCKKYEIFAVVRDESDGQVKLSQAINRRRDHPVRGLRKGKVHHLINPSIVGKTT